VTHYTKIPCFDVTSESFSPTNETCLTKSFIERGCARILKMMNKNDPLYNYSHINAMRYSSLESNIEQNSCTRLEKPMMQRTRITLGKDKYKIQNNL